MEQEITIELFPAGNGDAILVDLGQQLILIDGGYKSTFRDYLKPRLQELGASGRSLTKFIVTHVDADHISGAKALLEENGNANKPKIISIDEIWFNSYRHLQFKEKEAGFLKEKPQFEVPRGLESIEAEDQDREVSYRQGSTLGSLILKNGYNWNITFNESAVMADFPMRFELSDETTITVLGPCQAALNFMADKWYSYLRTMFSGKINEDDFFDDAFELMMEEMRQAEIPTTETRDNETLISGGDWVELYEKKWENEDNSPTNGSSITFLLEHGRRKMLFLGDAIPSQVVDQLKTLIPEQQFPFKVDVLKVPHHGAWSNNSPDLIQKIDSRYYLFSSNGLSHHHPHLETIALIVKSHGVKTLKSLLFNYKQFGSLMDIDDWKAKKTYNYEVIWPEVQYFTDIENGYVKLVLECQN